MYIDKNSGDAGYIGLELLEFENKPFEIQQKCYAVEKSVNEGYFNLDKAIDVYGITRQDFINYLLNNLIKEIHQSSDETISKEAGAKKLLKTIAYLAIIYSSKADFISKDLKNRFDELSLIGGLAK